MQRSPLRVLPFFVLAAALSAVQVAAQDRQASGSSQPAAAGERIGSEAVRRHVQYLAGPQLEGRGTARGKKLAAEYIRGRFEELRLEPLFKGDWYQELPGSKGEDGRAMAAGRNIGACLTGSDPRLKDEVIIISAHYDHLGIRGARIFPGADDNASGVAMLLETARRFSELRPAPRRTVAFLSCDLEENLLWGARWFVAHPPWPLERVRLFAVSEMIGRTLGDLPLETIFVLGSEHATGLKAIVDGVKLPAGPKTAHLGIDLVGTRSDYGPFWNEKIPFLFFSGGQHPDYHQPTDTADRIDYERVANVSELIFETCRQVADVDAAPAWTDKPVHDLDEVRTLHKITDLVLAADDASRATGKPKLSDLQRFTVANVRTRATQILDRGEIKPEERPWLIRSSQLLLLTVF